MKKELLSFVVNGRPYEMACPPNKLLLDVLREDLNLTPEYRREMIHVLTKRALVDLKEAC